MKKLVFILLILSFLSSCSGSPISLPFFSTPTQTSSSQPTVTPFSLDPTYTPDLFVLNTLPPTSTAMNGSTSVATPVATNTPLPTFTPTARATITLEPIAPSFFTPAPNLFNSVVRSTDVIVWGGTCEGARSIRFVAQVMPARRLRYVTLWYRLQDKYSGRHTNWGGGAILSKTSDGSYFYELDLSQINRYRYYQEAWLQYQLVASTVTQRVLGRSAVSRTDVTLVNCKVLNP